MEINIDQISYSEILDFKCEKCGKSFTQKNKEKSIRGHLMSRCRVTDSPSIDPTSSVRSVYLP